MSMLFPSNCTSLRVGHASPLASYGKLAGVYSLLALTCHAYMIRIPVFLLHLLYLISPQRLINRGGTLVYEADPPA